MKIIRLLCMWWGHEWGSGKCVCICCRTPQCWGQSISVLISWATLTKYHTLGGTISSLCPHSCRGWKRTIMVSVGLAPPEAFLADLSIGLLSASLHGPLSVLPSVPIFSSYKDVSQWIRVQPDNSLPSFRTLSPGNLTLRS